MWTKLSNGIVLVPKAFNVRLDNALVVEAERFYFVSAFSNLSKQTLYELYAYLERSDTVAQSYLILNGQKITEPLCFLCRNKFKGLTGTCGFLGRIHGFEENCSFIFEGQLPPSLLQVEGGVYLPPKYFDAAYYKYKRRSLSDFDFSAETVEATLAEIVQGQEAVAQVEERLTGSKSGGLDKRKGSCYNRAKMKKEWKL